MPRVSQVMIRTALLHFALGYTLGALSLIEKGLHLAPWLWSLKLSHTHVLLVGAMVQLAAGVAVWILPRLNAAGARGDLRRVWAGYAALNLGVVLAASCASLGALLGRPAPAWMPITAGALYALAAGLLAAHAWRRVLPFAAAPRDGTIQPPSAQR